MRKPLLPVVPALLLLIAVVLAGCTGPVRSFGVYESKAARTAKEEASAVENARLVVQAATGHKAFGRYLSQVLTETGDEASSIQSTFDAIQPPDGRSDQLQAELDDLLDAAATTIAALRTAARRGDFGAMPRLAAPLAGVSRKLDEFARAHQ